MFGDDIQVSGVPGTGTVASLNHQIAMTTRCAEKDAAWSFIRQWVTSLDGSQAAFEMPVLADEYQEFLSYTQQYFIEGHERGDMVNGKQMYLPTEADYAAWDAVMEGIVPLPQYEESVYALIREETEAYIEGNSTAQDAARVIQNRVKIMLAEGK